MPKLVQLAVQLEAAWSCVHAHAWVVRTAGTNRLLDSGNRCYVMRRSGHCGTALGCKANDLQSFYSVELNDYRKPPHGEFVA